MPRFSVHLCNLWNRLKMNINFCVFYSHLKYFTKFLMLHILALDFEAKRWWKKRKIYFINVSYMLNLVKKCQNFVGGLLWVTVHGLKFSNLEVGTYFCCVQKIRKDFVSFRLYRGLIRVCPAQLRACIFKRVWGPGIDSKEWIPPAYVAWRAGR